MAYILSIKTQSPPLAKQTVTREQVNHKIEENLYSKQGFASRLTLVSAPAGFGKTTTIRAYLDKKQEPHTWFSIDIEDNHLLKFWQYMIRAIQRINPKLGHEALTFLDSIDYQSYKEVPFQYYISSLLDDLILVDSPFYIILDDYHYIEDKQIHDSMIFFIEGLPQSIHLMITTRSDPPFPIYKWQAKRMANVLRLSDIKFDLIETQSLIKNQFNLDLDIDQIKQIYDKTEGWAAGLTMFAYSITPQHSIESTIKEFTGSQRHIYNFLAEEIYKQLPKNIQNFLLKTSFLKVFDVELCVKALEIQDAKEVIEYLYNSNIFLIPLDYQNKFYRYHHLFSNFLQHLLKQSSATVHDELHQKVSIYYQTLNDSSTAYYYANKIKDYHLLADIFNQYIEELIRLEGPDFIHVVDNISNDILTNYPKLIAYKTIYEIVFKGIGNVEATFKLYEHSKLKSQGNHEVTDAMINAIKCYLDLFMNQTKDGLEASKNAFKKIPSSYVFWHTILGFLMGDTLYFTGKPLEAYEQFKRLHEHNLHHNYHFLALSSSIKICASLKALGKFDETKKEAFKAVELIKKYHFSYLSKVGTIYMIIGDVLREEGKFEEALTYFDKGFANTTGDDLYSIWNHLYYIAYFYSIKQYEEALDIIYKIQSMLNYKTIPSVIQNEFDYWYVRILINKNLLNDAKKQLDLLKPPNDTLDGFERYHLTYNHYLITNNNLLEAHNRLELLLKHTKQNHSIHFYFETLLLKALILKKQHDESLEKLIKEIDSMRKTYGFNTLVNDYEISDSDANKLFAHYDSKFKEINSIKDNQTQSLLLEPLSAREVEVLTYIKDGYSNQDICDALYLSMSTVKWHTSNIYSKLGVKGRVQAIKIAKENNII